ncbi:hypothetical protein AOQ84DRAFT_248626, partial [Glonium stellatum]
ERVKEYYNQQYESWVPWIEDQYLKWFTKDNKTSYSVKQQLNKTKLTGIEQVDNLQDGVNNLAAGQLGKGGLGESIGKLASKEGVNRAERGGKDEHGKSTEKQGSLGGYTVPLTENAKKGGEGLVEGAKGAGGYLGGWFG